MLGRFLGLRYRKCTTNTKWRQEKDLGVSEVSMFLPRQQFLHDFADHLPVGLALQLRHELAHDLARILRALSRRLRR